MSAVAKALLEKAIANYAQLTIAEHTMKDDVRVIIMVDADRSDPLNCMLSIGAKKLTIEGKQVGWRVITPKDPQDWNGTLAKAIEALIKNMREYPHQDVQSIKLVEVA